MNDDERDTDRGATGPEPSAPTIAAAGDAPSGEDGEAAPPGFQTGVLHIRPELRGEVEAYWKARAVWERTKQGPPPEPPSVDVEVQQIGQPSEAAMVRAAFDETRGGEEKSGARDTGSSPWAADVGAAGVEKSLLPSAHRPRSAGAGADAGKAAARPGRARWVGALVAVLAIGVAIGIAATRTTPQPLVVEALKGEASAQRSERAPAAATSGAAAALAPSDAAAGPAQSDAAATAPAEEAPRPVQGATPQRVPAREPERKRPAAGAASSASPTPAATPRETPPPAAPAMTVDPPPASEPSLPQPKLKF